MLNSIVCTPNSTRIVRAPSEAAFILKEHEYVYLPWGMYVAIFSLSSIYVFKYTVCLFVCLWELNYIQAAWNICIIHLFWCLHYKTFSFSLLTDHCFDQCSGSFDLQQND